MFDAPIFTLAVVWRSGAPEPFPFRVLKFRFEDEESKVDKLTLTLDNEDLSAITTDKLRYLQKGVVLSFRWGYPGWMSIEHQAVIEAVKGLKQLTVEALGKQILAHADSRTRTWEGMRRSDVAHAIADELGYPGDMRDVSTTDETFEHMVQSRETDAQFLRRLAMAEGCDFWIDVAGFHWRPRQTTGQVIGTYYYFLDRQGRVLNFTPKTDVTALPAKIRVQTFDPDKGEVVDETIDNATAGDLPATGGYAEMGYTGDPVQDALVASDIAMMDAGYAPDAGVQNTKPAPLQPPEPQTVMKINPETGESYYETIAAPKVDEAMQRVSHEMVFTMASGTIAQAKKKAASAYGRARVEAVKGDLLLVGDPVIEPRQMLNLVVPGVELFSKTYYIRKVVTEIGGAPYTTMCEIDSEGVAKPTGKTAVETQGATPPDYQWDSDMAMLEAGFDIVAPSQQQAPAPPPLKQVMTIDPETGATKYIYVEGP